MTPDYIHTSDRCTIRFFNCDCMDYLKEFGDKSKSLGVVDPPYFSGPDKLGYYGQVKSKTKVKRQSYPIIGSWGVPEEPYFKELKRVSKNQIVWGINYYSIKNLGAGRIVWDKKNDFSTFSDGEIAYCSLIDTVRFFRFMWNGMLQQNMKNKEIRIHPTQKPIQLYRWILQNYAKPGDTIIDTHGGSCSLAIACEIEGFDLDICELDVEYFEKAIFRFKTHVSQKRFEF